MIYCLLLYKYALNVWVSLQCPTTLHLYTRDMLRVWPLHAMPFDPIDHFKCIIIYMLDLYIFIKF